MTRRSYQHHLDTYLLPCIGNIPLAMLTAADLRVMFTAIVRRRRAAGGPLSPATLARIRATLRAALNAAIREGLISVNPARSSWLAVVRGRCCTSALYCVPH